MSKENKIMPEWEKWIDMSVNSFISVGKDGKEYLDEADIYGLKGYLTEQYKKQRKALLAKEYIKGKRDGKSIASWQEEIKREKKALLKSLLMEEKDFRKEETDGKSYHLSGEEHTRGYSQAVQEQNKKIKKLL